MQALKVKCETLMRGHLEARGFPDMTDDEIMAEIPAMHKKLKNAELIPSAYTIEQFRATAVFQRRANNMFSQMKADAGI
jgi:hypothetical protein